MQGAQYPPLTARGVEQAEVVRGQGKNPIYKMAAQAALLIPLEITRLLSVEYFLVLLVEVAAAGGPRAEIQQILLAQVAKVLH